MTKENEPLHTKYRPETLDEIFGNETIVESLQSIMDRKKGKVRAFLFSGPSGCGKTTFARIIGNMLNCGTNDFKEFNTSDDRGINFIRALVKDVRYSPKGEAKVYLLDECHQITGTAQEALLKLLEEPPSKCYFVLATTEPQKLKNTVKNRCVSYEVKLTRKKEMKELLNFVIESEGIDDFPDSAITAIIKKAEGVPRSALTLLDKVIDIENEEVLLETIESHNIDDDNPEIIELCKALIKKAKWKEVSGILKTIPGDPEQIRLLVLKYFSTVLLNKGDERSALILEEFVEPFYNSGEAGLILACYNCH